MDSTGGPQFVVVSACLTALASLRPGTVPIGLHPQEKKLFTALAIKLSKDRDLYNEMVVDRVMTKAEDNFLP